MRLVSAHVWFLLALSCLGLVAGRACAEPPVERLATLGVAIDLEPAPPARNRQITILLAGDYGLSPHLEPVRADGALKHGLKLTWPEMLERIAPRIAADLKFANVETVVSNRNDLRPVPKQFNFRSHPEGVRTLVRAGFNVLSLANNHAMDFGSEGLFETLRHLRSMETDGLLAFAGIGATRSAAGQVARFAVKGKSFAFASIGIISTGHGHHRAGPNRPGQLSYRAAEDFEFVTDELASAAADFRMLSIHFGTEMSVEPAADQIRAARTIALAGRGIDLVAGHHAHVVQGIEIVDGRLVFYGLGNFLHLGTQDMAPHGLCRDYSIIARVHLAETAAGRLAARAVEIIPIMRTHVRPEPMPAEKARERIEVINHLSRRLAAGVAPSPPFQLAVQSDGSGLYCTADAAAEGGRIGDLCRGWQPPAPPPAALGHRIAASCGLAIARRHELMRSREHARALQRNRPSTLFMSLFGKQ